MNLFGWTLGRAKPALSRAGLTSFAAGRADGWTTAERVAAAYRRNPVAHRCVRLLAEAVGGAPLAASDPRLADLITRRTGGQPFGETVAAHLLLHGNAFVQVLADADGGVAELYALRPDRVAVEADGRGWPIAYRYRVGAEEARLTAEDGAGRTQVIHLRGFHPTDDHYGMGGLEAAADAVAAHNAATGWNRALLDNAARPSGALVYDPGDVAALSTDQFERLQGQLGEAYMGAVNAGRPMILDGGISWQPMSWTPAEMGFLALKRDAAREIALALGVPPLMLGLPGDDTHANYAEANRAFWRLAVLPLAGLILGALRQGLAPWFPGATVGVDQDQLPALSEDRQRLWDRVTAADFLSDAEKRAMLGIDR